MSRVDPRSQTIVINESMKITYTKEDVHRVFHIACTGRSVYHKGMPNKEVTSLVLSGFLGINGKENRSIKAAQEVIERDYGNEMSVHEQNAFKNALTNPSDIGNYDWSDYVIKRLFEAVVKVKSDLNSSVKIPSITGCTLFLQVLYLDSIDTGVLNLEPHTLPRIKFFGHEVMRSMILADTLSEGDDPSVCHFGRSQGHVIVIMVSERSRRMENTVVHFSCSLGSVLVMFYVSHLYGYTSIAWLVGRYSNGVARSKLSVDCFPVKTPADLGQRNELAVIDEAQALVVIQNFAQCQELGRSCIVHYTPKYIEVLVGGIKMQLAGLLEMEMDFFDAAIRRFKEMDDMLYDRKMYQRWRHFVESDFMVNTTSKFFMCNYMDGIFAYILAGTFDTSHPSIAHQFCYHHVNYDVSKCSMVCEIQLCNAFLYL
ncbi:hypothetical protein HU200_033113 [Digitaria exilis]|uniref:Uncharacterized protein n=1 Tax=Digitaria exilis TaxID=1010633 RepID=A0A835BVA8_9POAL|nr:hypothetical protein HU200_033113 [Digitaria exilis]